MRKGDYGFQPCSHVARWQNHGSHTDVIFFGGELNGKFKGMTSDQFDDNNPFRHSRWLGAGEILHRAKLGARA